MADLAERAQALKEIAEADVVFRNALAEAMQSGNIEEGIRLAAEKGIQLSAEELTPESGGRDLDDAELDAVAGGGFWDELGDGAECVAMGMMSLLDL